MAAIPDDPEAALTAAEAAHLAARDTVPIDVRPDPLSQRETVRLPRGQPGHRTGPRAGPAPLVLASGVATVWAATISAVPVVLAMSLAQAVEGGESLGAGIRLGLAGWLLGHGVPLETGSGQLALTPLGLALLAAWRVMRAGVHTTRGIRARRTGSPRRAGAVAGAIAVWYGLLGGLAALAVGDATTPRVSALHATAELALFGAVFGLAGAAYATGAFDTVWVRVPAVARDGVRTGVVVALLLCGASAAAAGISLALGAGEAGEVFGAYQTGVAGQAGITLICLAYGPNCAVWAAAYLIGPGFAVGAGTVIRVSDVSIGGLPAIPVFAGLPAGPVGAIGAVLLGVPVIVAMTAGWLLARRRFRQAEEEGPPARRGRGAAGCGRGTSPGGHDGCDPKLPPDVAWPTLLGSAALAGPVAGLLLGAAAVASAGSLGSGRLVEVGPVAWQVAVFGTAISTVGTIIGAAAGRSLRA